jgi:phosphoribosylaminoimidazolecarboxamide formyltransferase/IMP cyclohydrolase
MNARDGAIRITCALISVSDKRELSTLARRLARLPHPLIILSTGGTYSALAEHLPSDSHVQLQSVESYTGYPEMPGGLVKTLHPKIHAGLLAEAGDDAQAEYLSAHAIAPIDLVIVNLYPFQAAIAQSPTDLEHARRHIDIGGPTMIRAAAKNFGRVATVTAPDDYAALLAELETSDQCLSQATRWRLAQKAFEHVAIYDRAIADYLSASPGPITTMEGLLR